MPSQGGHLAQVLTPGGTLGGGKFKQGSYPVGGRMRNHRLNCMLVSLQSKANEGLMCLLERITEVDQRQQNEYSQRTRQPALQISYQPVLTAAARTVPTVWVIGLLLTEANSLKDTLSVRTWVLSLIKLQICPFVFFFFMCVIL